MATLSSPLTVELEGNHEPIEVTSDQRDLARWEAFEGRNESAVHLRARFVAWSACLRAGEYTGSWKDFNERDCIEVLSLVDVDADANPDGEDEQGLDPGQTTPSATA